MGVSDFRFEFRNLGAELLFRFHFARLPLWVSVLL